MRIVILTKSAKYGNYCVAGLNLENGKFVRLVSDDEDIDGALTADDISYENGEMFDKLDIVEVKTLGSVKNAIQPENVLLDRSSCPKCCGSMNIYEVIKRFKGTSDRCILGGNLYYVQEGVPEFLGKSLELARVQNLKIVREQNLNGAIKTKVVFSYNGLAYSHMSMTDYDYYSVPDDTVYKDAVIVVSIGNAYNGKHFKFVSAIYPLS